MRFATWSPDIPSFAVLTPREVIANDDDAFDHNTRPTGRGAAWETDNELQWITVAC